MADWLGWMRAVFGGAPGAQAPLGGGGGGTFSEPTPPDRVLDRDFLDVYREGMAKNFAEPGTPTSLATRGLAVADWVGPAAVLRGSVVTQGQGTPTPMYQGVPAALEHYRRSAPGVTGYHFYEDPGLASTLAHLHDPATRLKYTTQGQTLRVPAAPNVTKVYLNIEEPFDMTTKVTKDMAARLAKSAEGVSYRGAPNEPKRVFISDVFRSMVNDDAAVVFEVLDAVPKRVATDILRRAGYDSIKWSAGEWTVLDPQRIVNAFKYEGMRKSGRIGELPPVWHVD